MQTLCVCVRACLCVEREAENGGYAWLFDRWEWAHESNIFSSFAQVYYLITNIAIRMTSWFYPMQPKFFFHDFSQWSSCQYEVLDGWNYITLGETISLCFLLLFHIHFSAMKSVLNRDGGKSGGHDAVQNANRTSSYIPGF